MEGHRTRGKGGNYVLAVLIYEILTLKKPKEPFTFMCSMYVVFSIPFFSTQSDKLMEPNLKHYVLFILKLSSKRTMSLFQYWQK